MKERNLREMGRLPGFHFHEQDMLDVEALRGVAHARHRHRAPRREGGRAAVDRRSGGVCRRPTSPAPPRCSRPRAGPGCRGSRSARPPRSTVTARRRPFREDAVAVEPVSPYAATKRAAELLHPRRRADLRISLRRAAVLHGLRAPAAARPRHPRLRAPHGRGRGRSPCSATAPRRATTPTATTSSPASPPPSTGPPRRRSGWSRSTSAATARYPRA